MKKLLSIILCAAMIFSALPVCAADVQLKFGAQVTGTDTPVFRELKTAENGKIAAMVTIPTEVFTAAGTDTAKLYVVKYDNNEVAAVAVTDVAASSAGERVTTAPIDALATDTLKAFVWNGTTLAPIGKLEGLRQKSAILDYSWNEMNSGATIPTDSNNITAARNVTIVDDPEAGGTRKGVMKFLGTYDSTTNKQTGDFEFVTQTLNKDRSAINAVGGYVAVDYTFDVYIPREYAFKKADGSDNAASTALKFTFSGSSSNRNAQFQMWITDGTSNRIKFSNSIGDDTGWTTDTYWKNGSLGLYDRWIPVRVETRPYFVTDPSTGKETITAEYFETFLYFDNELIYHHRNTNSKIGTGTNGLEGRLYINTSNGYATGRAIYIDNFKVSI